MQKKALVLAVSAAFMIPVAFAQKGGKGGGGSEPDVGHPQGPVRSCSAWRTRAARSS